MAMLQSTYCIGHQAVQYQLPHAVAFIGTGDFRSEDHQKLSIQDTQIVSDRMGFNVHSAYQWLTGDAGLFYAAELLASQNAQVHSVNICQYRKFIASEPLGFAAENYPGMRIVPPGFDANDVFLKNQETQLLFSQPYVMPQGVFHQWATAHNIFDVLSLSSFAVASGILHPVELVWAFNAKVLIPGGFGFGIFPCEWFINAMNKLRHFNFYALDSGWRPAVPDDAYESRALSFCNERLGSYLLLKELSRVQTGNEYPDVENLEWLKILSTKYAGYMCTVGEQNYTTTRTHG